jgi:hypothetical protein
MAAIGPVTDWQVLISDVDIAAVPDHRMALSAVDPVAAVPLSVCKRQLLLEPAGHPRLSGANFSMPVALIREAQLYS